MFAAAAAGVANAVVGSGTLITFPTLLAFGYQPLLANVSNTVGLVFGNASSTATWRPELRGQRKRVVALGSASVVGGITGAGLLLVLPASAFRSVVPAFIALGVVLIVAQPWLSRYLSKRHREGHAASRTWPTFVALYLAGVYGGYFGAGQGLLILAVLVIAVADTLHRLTALRNVLASSTNAVAAVVFVLVAHVAWSAVALLAAGSIVGGWVGVHIGRRLPPVAYRTVIAVIGTVALVRLTV